MPNVFDETAEKAFNMIGIRKSWSKNRPSVEELDKIDEVIANMNGFAFRVGGGLEESVPQYAIGYVLPKGATMRLNQQDVVERLSECSYFDDEPFVTLTPVMLSEEELERATLVGTPPEEALEGLAELKHDLGRHFE